MKLHKDRCARGCQRPGVRGVQQRSTAPVAAPSGSGRRGWAASRSARTRRARARPRSTSTRACRARARTPSRPTRLVEQIKATLDGQKIGNFTIKYIDLDDSSAANNGDWDGAVEQPNANKAAADPDAMVYIGTYNSGAAKLAIPILNDACLVMISPANTYPGLTKAVEGVTQPGEPDSVLSDRVPQLRATDRHRRRPGRGAAPSGRKSQGKTKAYVLDDTPDLRRRSRPRRGPCTPTRSASTVVSPNATSEGFDAKATDYSALAQKIKASGADVIYIGSITGQNTGKLWKDLRAALPGHHDHVRRRRVREVLVRRRGRGRQRHVPHLRRRRPRPADRRRQGRGSTTTRRLTTATSRRPTRPTATRPRPSSLAALQEGRDQRSLRGPQGRHGDQGPRRPSSAT